MGSRGFALGPVETSPVDFPQFPAFFSSGLSFARAYPIVHQYYRAIIFSNSLHEVQDGRSQLLLEL